MELSTERSSGMGVGSIPVSKIWQYIDRFHLPDWWEPVLLQADAAIVSSFNKEAQDGSAAKHEDGSGNGQRREAIRSR
jgi:hypothetical protein